MPVKDVSKHTSKNVFNETFMYILYITVSLELKATELVVVETTFLLLCR
jgi:hypothetical protein